MKKTFAWGFCNQLNPVIDVLKAEEACDVVLWVGNTPNASYNIRRFFYGNFPRIDFKGCPYEIYERVYPEMGTYIDMACRHNNYNERTYHDYVNLFNRLIDYFFYLLTSHEIEVIVFSSMPHEGPDWILYMLGKAMGIQTVLLYQSLFPDRYFFAFDHLDYGEFRNVPVVSDYQAFKIPRAYEKDIFYMKNQKIYNYTWKDVILKELWKKRLTALWVHRNVRRYKRRLEELSEPDLNLDEPYVYFPLHLQPEMTTSTLGDQYNDQLLALERLHLETPDDWFIYIKENPIQTEVMRGDWFFERLKALPKVKMAPIQTSTYQLIKHSRFVATITGTAGWEAISGGKNVLVFGRPWYLSLPGVFKYENGFSLDNLVNNPIDHELLELALSQLMKKTGQGIVDEAYIKIMPDFDPLENGRKIACFLKKVLYGQPAPLKSF